MWGVVGLGCLVMWNGVCFVVGCSGVRVSLCCEMGCVALYCVVVMLVLDIFLLPKSSHLQRLQYLLLGF